MDLTRQIQSAFACYQERRFEEARQLLRPVIQVVPDHPDVLRLAGMIERGAGAPDKAISLLRRAAKSAPGNPECWNVLGLAYADSGQEEAAQAAYGRALDARSDYIPALLNLARLLMRSGRAEEAAERLASRAGDSDPVVLTQLGDALTRATGREEEAANAFRRALDIDPATHGARAGLAFLMVEENRCEAALDLLAGGPEPASADDRARLFYARLRALARLNRVQEALTAGRAALDARPGDLAALQACAQLLWMTGQGDAIRTLFERALSRSGNRLDVHLQYMDTLIKMGRPEAVKGEAARARRVHGDLPQIADQAASALIELGEGAAALAEARKAARAAGLTANLARAQLMTGDGKGARDTAREALERLPDNQFWISILASALRLLEDPEHGRFADPAREVMAYDLDPPEGWETIEAFNDDLAEALARYHVFSAHPLDQSLRQGTQTSVDLKRSDDPVLRAFFKALEKPINAFIARMGEDATHPLYRRKADRWRFTGAWSVRLSAGGHHVSHVHPEGWISSAYYVRTPPQTAGSATREGWLEFANPPFEIPGATPLRAVEPRPGRLALFPSYMWHGTVPISEGERMTIAFDVVPDPGGHR